MTRSLIIVAVASAFAIVLNGPAIAQDPQPDTDPATAPTSAEVASAINRACEILLANQESYVPDRPVGTIPDKELGKWQERERARLEKIRSVEDPKAEWPYEGVYRVRPDGRIPAGYRVGGTSIACLALVDAPASEGRSDATSKAIERGLGFVLDMLEEDPTLQPELQTRYDVRGWGHIYALSLLLRLTEKDAIGDALLAKRTAAMIPWLVDAIETGQIASGGWNYAGRGVSPFMTGAALLTLFDAASRGYDVDPSVVEKALDELEKGRGKSVAYAYSGRLRNPKEPMQGACARSAIAELALYRAGRSSTDQLRTAVAGFFAEENWQQLLVRKSQQGTHVAPYGVAPYYFFFGHTYAAIAVEHLPENERPPLRTKMRELLWRTIEPHGGWNDRVFPRTESYSTAMSILALTAEKLPKTKAWTPAGMKKAPEKEEEPASKPKTAEENEA